jgi:hypothetical protein
MQRIPIVARPAGQEARLVNTAEEQRLERQRREMNRRLEEQRESLFPNLFDPFGLERQLLYIPPPPLPPVALAEPSDPLTDRLEEQNVINQQEQDIRRRAREQGTTAEAIRLADQLEQLNVANERDMLRRRREQAVPTTNPTRQATNFSRIFSNPLQVFQRQPTLRQVAEPVALPVELPVAQIAEAIPIGYEYGEEEDEPEYDEEGNLLR